MDTARQVTNGRLPASAASDKRSEWYTRKEAAAALGVSVSALRRLQKQLDVPGEVSPSDRGGTVCRLSADDVERLSAGDKRGNRPAADKRQARQAASDSRQPAPAGDSGWREALALATAESDRLRSQLEAERVERQAAVRRAEEAERGHGAAVARLEALRAAWWRWYALATSRGLWSRLRGRLPEPPAELVADRLLTAGERAGVY